MKRCTECGGVKQSDEFSRDVRRTDGRRSKCKECVAKLDGRYVWPRRQRQFAPYGDRTGDQSRRRTSAEYLRAWRQSRPPEWHQLQRERHRERMRTPDGQPSYFAAHARLRATRGPAKNHTCVDCAGPAAEWSLPPGHGEFYTVGGVAYTMSLDVYEPRCSSCHRRLDVTQRRQPTPT